VKTAPREETMARPDLEKTKHMVSRALTWPKFPLLPMVNVYENYAPRLGMLHYWANPETEDGGPIRVYLVSMFTKVDDIRKVKCEEFKDIEGMYDAGWRID
jgi:hypothetical protein